MRRILAGIFLCLLIARPAFAVPAIEGFVTAGGSITSNAFAFTLSTSTANDVVIVFIGVGDGGSATLPSVTSITDSAGLTWASRKVVEHTTNGAVNFEEWYAVAPTVLSSDSITIHYAANATSTRIGAFGVSGANTAAPFDPSLSTALSQDNTTSGTSASVSLTTTHSNDLLIAALRNPTSPTLPSGFTTVGSVSATQFISYQNVSSTQTGLSVGYTWSSAAANVLIVDAIRGMDGNAGLVGATVF